MGSLPYAATVSLSFEPSHQPSVAIGAAITIKHCLLAAQLLPTLYNDVDIGWIEFRSVTFTSLPARRRSRVVPEPQNGSYMASPRFGVVEDRDAHSVNGFLGRVARFGFDMLDFP